MYIKNMSSRAHQNKLKNQQPKDHKKPAKPNKQASSGPKVAKQTPAQPKYDRRMAREVLRAHRDSTRNPALLRDTKKLYRALKSRGLASNNGADMILNHGSSGLHVNSSLQNQAEVAVGNPAMTFQASLITPGVYDSPYVDESHVCPCPHGIAHGSTQFVLDNFYYNIIFLAPSLASAISTSLSTQRSGLGFISAQQQSTTISTDNLTGVAAGWTSVYGNTTAAKKIFAWSSRAEISLMIPEAVVQGICYHGNAPASLVNGSTVQDLIRMSTEAAGEQGGATYCIKNSIVELGMAHAPYGAYSPTDYPQDERVSWIIFSPVSAGSITGSSVSTIGINVLTHTNYFWVPTYQPQVVGSTEPQVKAEAAAVISPKDREHISTVVQRSATTATISEMLGKASKYIGYGATAARVVGAFWSGASAFAGPAGLLASAMGAAAGALMAEEPFVPTESQRLDVEYIREHILPRWGPWEEYPPTVTDRIKEFDRALTNLQEAFDASQEILEEYREDHRTANNKIVTIEGKRQWTANLKSGSIPQDYEDKLSDRLRPKSVLSIAESRTTKR